MALATLNDLTKYHVNFEGRQSEAEALLESVSAAVTAAAGTPIIKGTYTVHLTGETSRKQDLPCKPVHSVQKVLINGEEITDYKLLGNALYREEQWSGTGIPNTVTVTFTAGLERVPEDIIRLVCILVAAGLNQSSGDSITLHRGEAYERIDDYQIGYTQGGNEILDSAELPEATRQMLRARFGGSAISIGVYR